MSDIEPANLIHTRIWHEEAEPDNPFAARAAYCRGYDVFGEMVGNARWIEMLVLLFRDELPDVASLDMLEALAVALANPGPRDPSVHAAMCGGVGGSSAAASLIAALSVGAGRYGGARDVYDAMNAWSACGQDLNSWSDYVANRKPDDADMWPFSEHPPGFDPHGKSASTIVRRLIDGITSIRGGPCMMWLKNCRQDLEKVTGLPLALSGVAAATFVDFGFTPNEGEMLYLLLRLPGAAVHALEQRELGYKKFPFYSVELEDDPRQKAAK